jgi:NSS family neurotransmitter:Na+ symporter
MAPTNQPDAPSTEKTVGRGFSGRWGLVIAALGMAVGAGNIWRFPRMAAQHGGGAFLLPWLLFTLLWSIPLLMVEFAMGKSTRKGPVGAFGALLGKRWTWMGGFVALCTLAIMFYYSVVTGWSAHYFLACLTRFDEVSRGASTHWTWLTEGNWVAVVFQILAAGGCGALLLKGVASGIERVCKVLVPVLTLLLLVATVRGVTLPGGVAGLQFLFAVDPEKLSQSSTWLQALSQSAWSTGAGWGLIVTYASYARKNEDVGLNSLITAVGDNSASVLAAMAILPAIFALAGSTEQALAITSDATGNTGMAFVWMVRLFGNLPAGGALFASLFFLALTAASASSLLAMMEMGTRVFVDFGLSRRKALTIVIGACLLCGLPSALSSDVFLNQDWVWGLGLLISGMLFASAVSLYGARRFRQQRINAKGCDWRVGRWFDVVIKWILPLEFLILMGWWLYRSATHFAAQAPFDPFAVFSVGTCLFQWGLALIVLVALSGWLYRWTQRGNAAAAALHQSAVDQSARDRGDAPGPDDGAEPHDPGEVK